MRCNGRHLKMVLLEKKTFSKITVVGQATLFVRPKTFRLGQREKPKVLIPWV
jgi:hypothetical protein